MPKRMVTYFSHDHSSADTSRHKYLASKTSTFYANSKGQLDSIVEESSSLDRTYRKVYSDFAYECPSCGVWPWRDGRSARTEAYAEGPNTTQIILSADRRTKQTNVIATSNGKQNVSINNKELLDEKGNLVSVFNYGFVPRDESKGSLYTYVYDNTGKLISVTQHDQPAEKQKGDTITHTTYVWSSNRIVRMEEFNAIHVWGPAHTVYTDLIWADSTNAQAVGNAVPPPVEKVRLRKHLLSYRATTRFSAGGDSLIRVVTNTHDSIYRVAKTITTDRHATATGVTAMPITHTETFVYFNDHVVQHWEVYTQSRDGTKQTRGEWSGRKYDDAGRMASQEMWVFEDYGQKGRWVKQEKLVFEY